MNVKLGVGIILFLVGIITAVFGIVGVGQVADRPLIEAEEATSHDATAQTVRTFVLPAVAALSLATGALLLGLSMGKWKNPRTHLQPGDEIVDPEGYQKMKHV
jgi:hypothetical protein